MTRVNKTYVHQRSSRGRLPGPKGSKTVSDTEAGDIAGTYEQERRLSALFARLTTFIFVTRPTGLLNRCSVITVHSYCCQIGRGDRPPVLPPPLGPVTFPDFGCTGVGVAGAD